MHISANIGDTIYFYISFQYACKDYDQTILILTEFLNPGEDENQKPSTRSKAKNKTSSDNFVCMLASYHFLHGACTISVLLDNTPVIKCTANPLPVSACLLITANKPHHSL